MIELLNEIKNDETVLEEHAVLNFGCCRICSTKVKENLVEACEDLMSLFKEDYDPISYRHVKVWNRAKQILKTAKGE